jgi:hypothetical protein
MIIEVFFGGISYHGFYKYRELAHFLSLIAEENLNFQHNPQFRVNLLVYDDPGPFF